MIKKKAKMTLKNLKKDKIRILSDILEIEKEYIENLKDPKDIEDYYLSVAEATADLYELLELVDESIKALGQL